MEPITTIPVDKSRIIVGMLGSLVGKNLIEVQRRGVNLSYSDEILNNALTTNREILLWSTKKHYIKSFDHDIDASGHIIVKFNNDDALTMPLINVTSVEDVFPKINPTTLREVFEEAKSNGRKAIFIDYPKATQQVINLNKVSIKEASQLIDKIMKDVSTIEEANAIEKSNCEMEMARLGEPIQIMLKGLV